MRATFPRARFRGGYAVDEVDAFLDQLDAALTRRDGSVTPEQVLEKRFTEVRFQDSYDPDHVDAFLDDVAVPLLQGRTAYDPERDYTGADLRTGGSQDDEARLEQLRDQVDAPQGGPFGDEPRPGLLARIFGRR